MFYHPDVSPNPTPNIFFHQYNIWTQVEKLVAKKSRKKQRYTISYTQKVKVSDFSKHRFFENKTVKKRLSA